jgi:hypothetical protein
MSQVLVTPTSLYVLQERNVTISEVHITPTSLYVLHERNEQTGFQTWLRGCA